MTPLAQQRLLLIGDRQGDLAPAVSQAWPEAQITCAATMFDGIAELTGGAFSAVFAAAEPIERRPEAAIRTLRHLAGKSKLVLFGHPTLEILSRKMLEHGCDDYLVTPSSAAEVRQVLAGASAAEANGNGALAPARNGKPPAPTARRGVDRLADLPLGEILLDALVQHPHDAPTAAVEAVNAQIGPGLQLHFAWRDDAAGKTNGDATASYPVRIGADEVASLHASGAEPDQAVALRHVLARMAPLFGKIAALQDRHTRLQKLAITDDMTGLYNARYFRHFLTRLMERAKAERFPVTLLLFDIDDFKKYNDLYGHGCGDEILKQTALLMRRCCRPHDLIARIGGDEFAAIFWDKEGPRQPRDPKKHVGAFRPPQTPVQIFERFKRLAATSDFSGLGASGRGKLSVSGGLAVYPYDAQTVDGLIKAADDYLMFRAKKAGKNSIYLVEGQDTGAAPQCH